MLQAVDYTITNNIVRRYRPAGIAPAPIPPEPLGNVVLIDSNVRVPAAARPDVKVVAPRTDADLMALGRKLRACVENEHTVEAAIGDDDSDLAEDRMRAANEGTRAVVDRIAEATATTLDGLIVKALALSWCRAADPIRAEDLCCDRPTVELRLAAGIARDLLAIGDPV